MNPFTSGVITPRGTWYRFTSASTKNALKLIAVFIGALLFLGIGLTVLFLTLFLICQ